MRRFLIALVIGAAAAAACSDDEPQPTEVLAKACDEGGTKHASGTTWTCSDGCNRCSCDNGAVESTTMACVDTGDPFQVDSNAPIDTNTPSDTAAPMDTAVGDAADGG